MQVQGSSHSVPFSNMQGVDHHQVSSQEAQGSMAEETRQASTPAQAPNAAPAGMATNLRALPGEHPAAERQSIPGNQVQDRPAQTQNAPQGQHRCTYTQSTGNLTCTDSQGQEVINHNGYSGRNVPGGIQGRNNPDAQGVEDTGPIPRGRYTIGPARESTNTGRAVRDLTPDPANNMEGRRAFQIHGDNQTHDASEGCIIMPREVRDRLRSGDSLEVVR